MTKKPQSLKRLTTEWYARLKESGFEDIEWYDSTTGKGQNSSMLKRPANAIAKKYNTNTEFHYKLCRNFQTFYDFKSTKDAELFELYTEGLSYREIYQVFKSSGLKTSLTSVFNRLKALLAKCNQWNKESVNGLLHDNTDLLIEDWLLSSIDLESIDKNSSEN